MANNQQKRFEVIHDEKPGFTEQIRIFRDTETGVCYLQIHSGASNSITSLLDSEGRVVVQR